MSGQLSDALTDLSLLKIKWETKLDGPHNTKIRVMRNVDILSNGLSECMHVCVGITE